MLCLRNNWGDDIEVTPLIGQIGSNLLEPATPYVTLMRTGASRDHKTVRMGDFLCVEDSIRKFSASEMLAYLVTAEKASV